MPTGLLFMTNGAEVILIFAGVAFVALWFGALFSGICYAIILFRRGRKLPGAMMMLAVLLILFGPALPARLDYWSLKRAVRTHIADTGLPDLTGKTVLYIKPLNDPRAMDENMCRALLEHSGARAVYVGAWPSWPLEGGHEQYKTVRGATDFAAMIRGHMALTPPKPTAQHAASDGDQNPGVQADCRFVPGAVGTMPDYLMVSDLTPVMSLLYDKDHMADLSADDRERVRYGLYLAPLPDPHAHLISWDNADLLTARIQARWPPIIWFPGAQGRRETLPPPRQTQQVVNQVLCPKGTADCPL